MQKSVIDQLKRKQIAALLEQDKRIDGRGLEEQRKLVLETGSSYGHRLSCLHFQIQCMLQPFHVWKTQPLVITGESGIYFKPSQRIPSLINSPLSWIT